MPSTYVTYRVDDRIATITLNRPEKKNALNPLLILELEDALHDAERDEAARVVLLTGAGSDFSAGADLEYLEEISHNTPSENYDDSRRLMKMMYAWNTAAKPTIAVVNGNALGGGCGLALSCDIVVAAENARIGFTEVRLGFVPAIVSRIAIDRVGKGKAFELMLRANILTAAEAHAAGLINHIAPKEDAVSVAANIAREMCTNTAPQAIALTKELLKEIHDLPLLEAMEFGAKINAISRTTENFQRGVSAFLKKEKIVW